MVYYSGAMIVPLHPIPPSSFLFLSSALCSLDKSVLTTIFPPFLQSRELEICVRIRDGDSTVLSGLLYLRLEDYFESSSSTYCLPVEAQGILLAEVGHVTNHLSTVL